MEFPCIPCPYRTGLCISPYVKMKKTIVLGLILLFILVVIALIFLIPSIRCKNSGGSYEGVGLAGNSMCIITYKDAGQSCTNSSQCEGRCIYDGRNSNGELNSGYIEFANNYKSGDKLQVNGYCEENNNPFKCSTEVINGYIESPVLCAD